MAPVIFFGVDPGSCTTGYGVIRTENNSMRWLDSGTLSTQSSAGLAQRLVTIYEGVSRNLQLYPQGYVCVEQAFYAKNVHTTLTLGHARGVILLAAQQAGWHILEYSPREIKKAVVGNGNAQKDQVAFMITRLLAPPVDKRQPDACDALAAAVCGFYQIGARAALSVVPARRSPPGGMRCRVKSRT